MKNMKRLLVIPLALASLAALGLTVASLALADGERETHRTFVEATQAYEAGEYVEAARGFERAVEDVENGRLYYNAGNAWLKAGDLGRATLWYERARRFMPRDPELAFNLDYARSLLRDPVQGGGALARALFFPRDWLSPRGLQGLALAGLWLSLGALALSLWLRRPVARRGLRWLAVVGGLVTLVALPSALADWRDAGPAGKAVVLAETLPVRSGLSEDATELFTLHAGAPVRIEESRGDWARVRFSEDRLGWVPSTTVERLWPPRPTPAAAELPTGGPSS